MIDPYASCPCGSGKKFKWCCQPIHDQIEKALNQQQNGQGEAALHTIEEVVRANPKNPEALGRKAQLLHVNGRHEEAEKVLDEAFAENASYPYGFLLRGLFRLDEGEQPGAMLLFRKATEVYAPDTVDQLSFLYEQIGNFELHRNNIVAARYAFGQCVRLIPENQELRQAFDGIFGPQSRTPLVARQEYRLIGFDAKRPPEWQEAFSKGNSGKLSEAVKLFEGFAKQPKPDPVAFYNAGLVRAWQGENAKAVEHFDKYIEKEPSEEKTAAAAALIEVLRLGDEMADQADYLQHRHLLRFGNADAMVNLIQEWDRAGRLVGVRSDQENGVLVGLLLQESTGLIGAAAPAAVAVGAQFAVVRDTLSLTHTNHDTLTKIVAEAKNHLGGNILEEKDGTATAQFGEVLLETLMLPPYGRATPELLTKSAERAAQFFEEEWASRPLKSLGGKTPTDAASNPTLRRKLLGDILFLEQCYFAGAPKPPKGADQPPLYDFSRLRHKLGVDTAPPPPQIDFAGMNAAELSAVDAEALTADQLEKAFRAAVNLEARELPKKFVQALVAKADPNKPDLFPFFKYLVDQAQTQADWDAALRHVDDGLKTDAERNQGQRRNDYELRRGQLLAKKGDAANASEAFQALIDRVPAEPKYRGSAAEAMLGLRQGSRALKFAEGGLEAARKVGNRDLEAYFQELVAAAKKQGA